MRIGLLADIHANLPALEAAYGILTRAECDMIVNLGDAITIGPHPEESLQFLRTHEVPSIAGNHEDDLVMGFTPELERRMGDGERAHYLWTHAQLSADAVAYLSGLPHTLEIPTPGGTLLCVHYYLEDGRVADARIEVDRSTLENAFGKECAIVAFGHTHHALVLDEKNPHFVNPGPAGLHHTGGPTIMALEISSDEPPVCRIMPVEYDLQPTLQDLRQRAVPDAPYIRRTFFGDRSD